MYWLDNVMYAVQSAQYDGANRQIGRPLSLMHRDGAIEASCRASSRASTANGASVSKFGALRRIAMLPPSTKCI